MSCCGFFNKYNLILVHCILIYVNRLDTITRSVSVYDNLTGSCWRHTKPSELIRFFAAAQIIARNVLAFTFSRSICIPDRIFRVVQVYLMKFTFLGSYFVLFRGNNCPSPACEKFLPVAVTKHKRIRARSAVKRICRFRNEIRASSLFFC